MQKCLIVVDYQVDFVTGPLGFPGAAALDAVISEKIAVYRNRKDAVVFTFDTHGENYPYTREGKFLPVLHCIQGTAGHDLFGNVGKIIRPRDKRFYKNTFGSGELYEYLKITPFSEIELVGLVSNICVLANAILVRTAQPETPVTVDAACTAGPDNSLHLAAMDVMEALQIAVINRGRDEHAQ